MGEGEVSASFHFLCVKSERRKSCLTSGKKASVRQTNCDTTTITSRFNSCRFIKRYDGSRCPEFQKGAQFYSAALAQSAALHGADTALRVTRDERLQFKEGWETGLPWRDEGNHYDVIGWCGFNFFSAVAADLLDDLVDLDRAAAQPRARASRRKADDNSVSMETDLSPGSVGAASSNSKLPNGDEPQGSKQTICFMTPA